MFLLLPSFFSFLLSLFQSHQLHAFLFLLYATYRSATYFILLRIIYTINPRLTINLTEISLIRIGVRTIFSLSRYSRIEYILLSV